MNAIKVLAAWGLALALPLAASAGTFPEKDKTLRIVVPFAAGGGVDNAARLLGEQLRKQLGLTVIVENKAGASGTVGGRAVQTAPADGYTLLFSAATHVLAQQVLRSPPYDPQVDFIAVARVGEAPLVLVVSPQRPEKNVTELMAAARKQPEKLMAAIPAAGAPSHLATLLLSKQGEAKLTYVPYKGTQPALADVAGGHSDLLLDSMISVMPLARSGRVKPLAITSKRRSTLMPEVPTMQEAGLANFSYVSWYGVWLPKGTPPERVALLNKEINAAVATLSKSGAFASLGIEPVTESPEQFQRYIAADVTQAAELLRQAGFKPE
jgi:tripartite-type tricarboxylate transporter receptor subunit TctC